MATELLLEQMKEAGPYGDSSQEGAAHNNSGGQHTQLLL